MAAAVLSALGAIRRPYKIVAAIMALAVGLVTLLSWWQGRARVSVDVRHYAHGPISEASLSELREWIKGNPGRAYDVLDIVWRNRGEVPVSDVSVMVVVPQDAEILTCDLPEPSLRPRLRIERLSNQCAIGVDRIAAGSRDSVRVRYRSPAVNWLYLCDLHGWKGDICSAARPSADSAYPVSVIAQGSGPPIRVRIKKVFREQP